MLESTDNDEEVEVMEERPARNRRENIREIIQNNFIFSNEIFDLLLTKIVPLKKLIL